MGFSKDAKLLNAAKSHCLVSRGGSLDKDLATI